MAALLNYPMCICASPHVGFDGYCKNCRKQRAEPEKSHVAERVVRSRKGGLVHVTEVRLSREMRRALRVPKDALRGPVR